MKILIMTDNPNLATGMARVGREIALGLHSFGHQIIYIGWFLHWNIENGMPFKVYSTSNQYYGADIFDKVIMKERPDCVLTIGDFWMVEHIVDSQTRFLFKWIGYVPIDGEKIGGGIVDRFHRVLTDLDYIVVYNEYGKEAILKSLPQLKDYISIIYHGVDTEKYYPKTEEEILNIKQKFNLEEAFIFLTVARNQHRKNLPEIFKIFAQFIDKYNYKDKSIYFWPHTFFKDPMGWDLEELIKNLNIEKHLIFLNNVAYGKNQLTANIPENILNDIYNCCDAFMLLSSEGFGLPIFEAMACRKPCLLLNHSGASVLGADNRALMVEPNYYITGQYGSEKPLPDFEKTVFALQEIYADKKLRETIADNGYQFAIKYNWKNIIGQWVELLEKVETKIEIKEFYNGIEMVRSI